MIKNWNKLHILCRCFYILKYWKSYFHTNVTCLFSAFIFCTHTHTANGWKQGKHCELKLRPPKHMSTVAFQSFYRIESELTAVEQGGDRHQLTHKYSFSPSRRVTVPISKLDRTHINITQFNYIAISFDIFKHRPIFLIFIRYDTQRKLKPYNFLLSAQNKIKFLITMKCWVHKSLETSNWMFLWYLGIWSRIGEENLRKKCYIVSEENQITAVDDSLQCWRQQNRRISWMQFLFRNF